MELLGGKKLIKIKTRFTIMTFVSICMVSMLTGCGKKPDDNFNTDIITADYAIQQYRSTADVIDYPEDFKSYFARNKKYEADQIKLEYIYNSAGQCGQHYIREYDNNNRIISMRREDYLEEIGEFCTITTEQFIYNEDGTYIEIVDNYKYNNESVEHFSHEIELYNALEQKISHELTLEEQTSDITILYELRADKTETQKTITSDGEILSEYIAKYDDNGNIIKLVRLEYNHGKADIDWERDYTYDSNGNLIKTQDTDENRNSEKCYEYDENNNCIHEYLLSELNVGLDSYFTRIDYDVYYEYEDGRLVEERTEYPDRTIRCVYEY